LPNPLHPDYQDAVMVHEVFLRNKTWDEQQRTALLSSDPEVYSEAWKHWQKLEEQVALYCRITTVAKDLVATPEATRILEEVRQKYRQADRQFASLDVKRLGGMQTMIEWVALRMGYFADGQIGADIDRTLSTDETDYLAYILGNPQLENMMKKNSRDAFPWAVARYVREPLLTLQDNFWGIGRKMKMRPGVPEFFQLAEKQAMPITIISAQFRPIVEGFLADKIPAVLKRARINAIDANDISASDKSTVTAQSVLNNPDKAMLLYFDGLTDVGCFQGLARGLSACAFILEGSEVENGVRDSGMPFFTFRDFHQNIDILQRILTRRDELKQELKL